MIGDSLANCLQCHWAASNGRADGRLECFREPVLVRTVVPNRTEPASGLRTGEAP